MNAEISKFEEYIDRFNDWFDETTPEYVVRGRYHHKIRSTRGLDQIERVALAIPEPLWKRWATFSILLVAAFIGVWIVTLGLLFGWGVVELWNAILAFEFKIPESPPTPEFSLEMLINDIIVGIIYYLAYCVVFLLLLPGITLHEFGHFAAAVRNGFEVESYGLIFLGPIPMGAYVEIGDQNQPEYNLRTYLEVYSAGIVNNFGWGLVLISSSLLIIANAPSGFEGMIAGLQYVPVQWSIQYWIAASVLLIGIFEILMGWSNAIPLWKVDGGHYAKTLIREWWGFDKALGEMRFGP